MRTRDGVDVTLTKDQILLEMTSELGAGKSTLLHELAQLGYTSRSLYSSDIHTERAIVHRHKWTT